MRRIFIALLATFAAWLGLVVPSAACMDLSTSTAVGHHYDSHQNIVALSNTTAERGPTASFRQQAINDAGGRWSNGASARLDDTTPGATTAYNAPPAGAQVTLATGATRERAQGTGGELPSFDWFGVAANGRAVSVRLGQAGESAVRSAYDIGPKASADIAGRTRILDGLTDSAVSEAKNVARQSLTLQLRDSLAYAQSTGPSFDLYVRPDTYLTGPLRDAIIRGDITLRFIP